MCKRPAGLRDGRYLGRNAAEQVFGKAYCVRVDPPTLIATVGIPNSSAINVASMIGTQSEGVASCILNAGGVLNYPSGNLVICLWH